MPPHPAPVPNIRHWGRACRPPSVSINAIRAPTVSPLYESIAAPTFASMPELRSALQFPESAPRRVTRRDTQASNIRRAEGLCFADRTTHLVGAGHIHGYRPGVRSQLRDLGNRADRPGGPRRFLGFPITHSARYRCAMAADRSPLDEHPKNRRQSMTRNQRRWHLWIWLTLAPLAAIAATSAVASRRPWPVQPPPGTNLAIEAYHPGDQR